MEVFSQCSSGSAGPVGTVDSDEGSARHAPPFSDIWKDILVPYRSLTIRDTKCFLHMDNSRAQSRSRWIKSSVTSFCLLVLGDAIMLIVQILLEHDAMPRYERPGWIILIFVTSRAWKVEMPYRIDT